ncbi:MAG: hypothetical protein QXV17_08830 [Candidatus Micrarchaeaceae archaeon]
MTEIPQAQPKKKSRKKLYAVIAVILIIVIIAVVAAAPKTYTETIMSSGTVKSLGAGQYIYAAFTVPSGDTASVQGSYISSGNIEVAVMNAAEYSSFVNGSSSISNAIFYSGDNTGATISASMGSGTYYIVIFDANIITPDTFTVVNSITVSITS